MSGALWAIAAGAGFGVFQALNRRAVHGMDATMSTFLQLVISAVVLAIATLLTVDLSILKTTSLTAWVNFALAGFFHFFIGWTLLNTSQKKIGAARTSPLIGTTPLFGAVVGAVFFAEFPDWVSWVGIGLIIFGVFLVTRPAGENGSGTEIPEEQLSWKSYLYALGASLAWSISPLFIRQGFAEVHVPTLGVAIGTIASAVAYIIPLSLSRRQHQNLFGDTSLDALLFKLVAGILVGVSTWARWIALDLISVATALAIMMISTPIVLVLSPYVMGKHLERITLKLVLGAGLVLVGALILVLAP